MAALQSASRTAALKEVEIRDTIDAIAHSEAEVADMWTEVDRLTAERAYVKRALSALEEIGLTRSAA